MLVFWLFMKNYKLGEIYFSLKIIMCCEYFGIIVMMIGFIFVVYLCDWFLFGKVFIFLNYVYWFVGVLFISLIFRMLKYNIKILYEEDCF